MQLRLKELAKPNMASNKSCINEDQKYQGALYKEKTRKPKNTNANTNNNNQSVNSVARHPNGRQKNMSQQAYVEDIGEDRACEPWNDSVRQTEDEPSTAEAPFEAPSPPAAAIEDHVNVFDFLVATGQTPNASNLNLAIDPHSADNGKSTSLVRYEYESKKDLMQDGDDLIHYVPETVPADDAFVTPVAKTERRRSKDGELKKDKKRKRLHVDTPGDQVMTDAPPVLHSGLTGGLKGMMRPVYPPSPDYSGGDANEISAASPLKKTKHAKHAKGGQVSNSLFDMIAGGVKKSSKRKSKKHSRRHNDKKDPKLIEFRAQSKDGKTGSIDGQMVVFKPRAEAFMSLVNKGPESEKGCSMNKVLKRFHRERQASGSSMAKAEEEKELWRTLRMRRNERGEVVLFTVNVEH